MVSEFLFEGASSNPYFLILNTQNFLKNFDLVKEKYDDLIRSLFEMPHGRYAVVLDDFGNRIAGGMKVGIESTTTEVAERRLEVQAVLILRMAEGYEEFDGKVHYSSIRWDKVLAHFFILSTNTALALTLQGSAPTYHIEKVRQVVEKSKRNRN